MTSRLLKVVLAALFLAVSALPVSAQVYTGRIDVTCVDSTGAVLPGVTVEIGGTQKNMAVTDASGAIDDEGLRHAVDPEVDADATEQLALGLGHVRVARAGQDVDRWLVEQTEHHRGKRLDAAQDVDLVHAGQVCAVQHCRVARLALRWR